MTSQAITAKLDQQLAGMPIEKQRRVLDYARTLSKPHRSTASQVTDQPTERPITAVGFDRTLPKIRACWGSSLILPQICRALSGGGY